MPELALSIEMVPIGLVPSLLKCPLYFPCLFCEQSESFLKPMTPSPSLGEIIKVRAWFLVWNQLRRTVSFIPTRSRKEGGG